MHHPLLYQRVTELIDAGRYIDSHGWVPATSGNFSAKIGHDRFAITVSGRHKGRLTADDIMVIDEEGRGIETTLRPSAETLLHTQLYHYLPTIGAILHTHSLHATLLSRAHVGGVITFSGYELVKAFGLLSHESPLEVPVVANDQDIPRLAAAVAPWLEKGNIFGYLIAGHGLYTWGKTVDDALRHIEAFEFLFACELQSIKG
jgi:methylthioribulose-1-phosphate dehydratase